MARRSAGGGTRAAETLLSAGVEFEVLSYDPVAILGLATKRRERDQAGANAASLAGEGFPADSGDADTLGERAALALGLDPSAVFKTLVVQADDHLVVAVVPVDRHLDLKALAGAAGVKRTAMATRDVAERSTGYVTGGISPLGQRKTLPTYIDSSAQDLDVITVNAGQRGLMIQIAPEDLRRESNAEWASIARD